MFIFHKFVALSFARKDKPSMNIRKAFICLRTYQISWSYLKHCTFFEAQTTWTQREIFLDFYWPKSLIMSYDFTIMLVRVAFVLNDLIEKINEEGLKVLTLKFDLQDYKWPLKYKFSTYACLRSRFDNYGTKRNASIGYSN